jgi:hypothetical protein
VITSWTAWYQALPQFWQLRNSSRIKYFTFCYYFQISKLCHIVYLLCDRPPYKRHRFQGFNLYSWSRLMRSSRCLNVCEYIPNNFQTTKPIFMKLDTYNMTREIISMACVPLTFLPSTCTCVCVSLLSLLNKGSLKHILRFAARQRLGKSVTMAMNT